MVKRAFEAFLFPQFPAPSGQGFVVTFPLGAPHLFSCLIKVGLFEDKRFPSLPPVFRTRQAAPPASSSSVVPVFFYVVLVRFSSTFYLSPAAFKFY